MNRGDRLWITCQRCGKKYSMMPSDYRKRVKKGQVRFFCSKACVDLDRKGKCFYPRK